MKSIWINLIFIFGKIYINKKKFFNVIEIDGYFYMLVKYLYFNLRGKIMIMGNIKFFFGKVRDKIRLFIFFMIVEYCFGGGN